MTTHIKPTAFILTVVVAMFLTAFGVYYTARATNSLTTQPNVYTPTCTMLNATTTSATSSQTSDGSGVCPVAGANSVVLYFSRGDATGTGNSGNDQFRIQVTPDGTNWYEYGRLASSTPLGQISLMPLVGTTTLAASTSTVMYRMTDLGYFQIRCISIETTDGEATCKASVTY